MQRGVCHLLPLCCLYHVQWSGSDFWIPIAYNQLFKQKKNARYNCLPRPCPVACHQRSQPTAALSPHVLCSYKCHSLLIESPLVLEPLPISADTLDLLAVEIRYYQVAIAVSIHRLRNLPLKSHEWPLTRIPRRRVAWIHAVFPDTREELDLFARHLCLPAPIAQVE